MSKRKKSGAAKGPSKRSKNVGKPAAAPVSPDEASLDRLAVESAAPELDDQPPASTPSEPEADAAQRSEETDVDAARSTDDEAQPDGGDDPSGEGHLDDAAHIEGAARIDDPAHEERPSDIAPSAPSLHEAMQPGEQLEIDGLDDDDDAPGSGPGDTSERAHLKGLIEALIFAADKPLKVGDLARHAEAAPKVVRALLVELAADYRPRGIQLDDVGNGYQFRTNPRYGAFVRDLTAQKPVRLTRAQLETLAILAYRQPITRPEIDEIRGVDSGPVLKMLLERELVRILGKKDEPGRPILYGTTPQFLEFFGLVSLKDLPSLREFTELTDESQAVAERELGDAWRRPVAEPDIDDGSLGEPAPEDEPLGAEPGVDEELLGAERDEPGDDAGTDPEEPAELQAPSEADEQLIEQALSTPAEETLADASEPLEDQGSAPQDEAVADDGMVHDDAASVDETSQAEADDDLDPRDDQPIWEPPTAALDETNDAEPAPSETDGDAPPSV